jgi:hypothetical protein
VKYVVPPQVHQTDKDTSFVSLVPLLTPYCLLYVLTEFKSKLQGLDILVPESFRNIFNDGLNQGLPVYYPGYGHRRSQHNHIGHLLAL